MSNGDSKRQVVLGIDIGTTNIKCYAYDKCCNMIGGAYERMTVLNPGDGRHEIEPDVLWNAFQNVVKKCLSNSQLKAADITCLGISTLRASFITWNRQTQETFHNFITWKDRRCEKQCEEWNSSFITKLLRFGAGTLYFFTRMKIFQIMSTLKFTSGMVLTRFFWMLKHDEEIRHKVFQKEALFGTIDTWLIWKLTGGKVHATDPSNACVSGFFDIFKMEWSKLILRGFNIPGNILPEVKNTCDFYGHILPEIFGVAIPICAVMGDQQASIFGAGSFKKNDINCTMGTGTFLHVNTGYEPAPSRSGIYPLIGWTIASNATYILESGMHDVATVLHVAQNLGFLDDPNTSSEVAQSVSDSNGVYFIPSACMLETAGKRNVNMSSMVGLKSQTSKEHLVRAVLESLAFQVRMLLDGIEKNYGTKTGIIRVSGGIAKNDFILQLVSDLSMKIVKRSKHSECSSLGVALIAGLFKGVWKNRDEIIAMQSECDVFFPSSITENVYERLYLNWKKAVSRPIINSF
ncbi:putative glycerol kinase 5 [Nephila pilipes]|uniref:Glycerol kinase 5 n=1 Tax=Nephila pilipes TaxID=299642 RepID=A0A8X6U8I4_NEPPI|nr:putative glycerol kinase 5 [Nephila pilipes]